MLSYLPLSISDIKSCVVRTSGTIAFLKRPTSASHQLRPSKKTTSSPRSATSSLTFSGVRCSPPPTTPDSSTSVSSASPNATSSSRSSSTPQFWKISNFLPLVPDGQSHELVRVVHRHSRYHRSISHRDQTSLWFCAGLLARVISPPTVPLMPCLLMMMRPRRPRRSHSSRLPEHDSLWVSNRLERVVQ